MSAWSEHTQPEKGAAMDGKFLSEFASPPSPYRGKPFWAWNGRLEESELRRQVRVFKQMGLGGFFMHSRVGLATAYLSEEWFRCVRACIDEARKIGLEAWLYDEDRWPSGAAGGLVTRDPKYRQRCLKMDEFKDPRDFRWTSATLGAVTARVEGTSAANVRPVRKGSRPKALAAGESLLAFRVEVEKPNPWYNGYTYLDTMSHEAVRRYIKVTHEAYRKRVGKDFGAAVPGIFTDEPNYGWLPDTAVPWTDRLPAVFRKRYGYDILDHLVELFYDVDGLPVSRARWNFQDCVTHLFVDAFSRQIGQWCAANGILFTGHVLAEETLRSQTVCVGSCMRHYEHMQAPGMDLLTERSRQYTTAKQVASAARQFGAKWRLSEVYGCTGWDFSFESHKAVGDWEAALGINLRCQHLAWYTMLAEAKRDYPAAIFYQSPWWEMYGTVEDYFARMTVLMTRGQEVRDLLVIHPVESMWTMRKVGWLKDAATTAYDQMLDELGDSLLQEQIDFDYGDEELLSRHARVARAAGAPILKVGKAAYKAVLVPPLKTMRSTTLALLREFAAAGGTVVFAGQAAAYVDALPSPAAAEFAAGCRRAPHKGKQLADAVATAARRISISDPAGAAIAPAIYCLREDRDAFYLFVVNTSRLPRTGGADDVPARDRRAAFADVRIRGFAGCKGPPVELDAATGRLYAAEAAPTADGWEIRTSLPRLASRLFVIPKKAGREAPARPKTLRDVRAEPVAPARWDISLSECNNVVLDRPRFKIGNGPWQGPEEILRVDCKVRDALGIAHRGGAMVQPWAQAKPGNPKRVGVSLAYAFDVQAIPSGELLVALERPELFRAAVNGAALSADAECGWWVDKSLRTLPVDPALLHVGANELTLECQYDCTHSGLEIIYLLGNFGTTVDGTQVTVTAPPQSLALGDWVGQGLAFYSGSVTYRQTVRPQVAAGQRLFVRVGDYRGVAVRVLVDGMAAGVIAWEPQELDITDLAAGRDQVELGVEVIGHRRNSHGPHHLNEKWPHWTGPGEYVAGPDRWFDGYQLVPCGLMSPPELVVRE
jgi:hypothetical protein